LKQVYDLRSAEIAAQMEKLEVQRQALAARREALRGGLPAPLLKRYEFILTRRNGSAISEVRAGVCQGCHLNILPQQYIDLQKGEEIIQCPHCQRILYWLGEEEEGGLRPRPEGLLIPWETPNWFSPRSWRPWPRTLMWKGSCAASASAGRNWQASFGIRRNI
jgi:hypothetical protein